MEKLFKIRWEKDYVIEMVRPLILEKLQISDFGTNLLNKNDKLEKHFSIVL